MLGGLMMKGTGVVLDAEKDVGAVAPASLVDKSRFGTDGVCTNITWVQIPPFGLWVMDFNAALPSYVVITAPQLNFTSGDFSVVMRVKVDTVAAVHYLLSRGWANVDGYMMYIHPNDKVYVYTYQAAATQATNSAASVTSTNEWYTIGFSRSGATILIYINGIEDVDVAGVHIDPLTSARTVKIGIADNLAGGPLDGKIGFLRIFNYALSAGQHLKMHEANRRFFGV